MRHALWPLLAVLPAPTPPQEPAPDPRPEAVAAACQPIVDALVERGVPGASAAVRLPCGALVAVTAGFADTEAERPMMPGDRMLAGSAGKTWVTAVAHHLVHAGKLDLDAPAASWFDGEPEWTTRVPNGRAVTLRQLLRHQSGIPRYVFEPAFTATLVAEPDRVWKPEELLSHVFDDEPLFAPGEGWAYSDTSYVVAGMVIEEVAGEPFYAYARRNFVEPFALDDTLPSDRREIPRMAQGYVVTGRQMGIPERALADGAFVYNVQFEWCGGGWATTPGDLARWAAILYSGEAFDAPYLATMLEAVEAPALGPGTRYGLGAMLRETPLGRLVHHDGFMPGYLTSMGYLPDADVGVALQVNTDDGRLLGRPPALVSIELAQAALAALETLER